MVISQEPDKKSNINNNLNSLTVKIDSIIFILDSLNNE